MLGPELCSETQLGELRPGGRLTLDSASSVSPLTEQSQKNTRDRLNSAGSASGQTCLPPFWVWVLVGTDQQGRARSRRWGVFGRGPGLGGWLTRSPSEWGLCFYKEGTLRPGGARGRGRSGLRSEIPPGRRGRQANGAETSINGWLWRTLPAPFSPRCRTCEKFCHKNKHFAPKKRSPKTPRVGERMGHYCPRPSTTCVRDPMSRPTAFGGPCSVLPWWGGGGSFPGAVAGSQAACTHLDLADSRGLSPGATR